MRRTILVFNAVALILATVGTPAAAYPKNQQEWDTWCDMNGDGSRETHTTQVASYQPGWTIAPVAVKAPAIWFGGHVDVYVNGVLDPDLSADVYPPLGMEDRLTSCTQEATFPVEDAVWRVVWDPLWLFFPPPAIP